MKDPLQVYNSREDGLLEPQKHRLDIIARRYGDDLADMIDYALWLYLNPTIDEDVDIDSPEWDGSKPSRWNIKAFLNCVISNHLAVFGSDGKKEKEGRIKLLDTLVKNFREREWKFIRESDDE